MARLSMIGLAPPGADLAYLTFRTEIDLLPDYLSGLGRAGTAPVLFATEGCDPVGAAFLNTTYAGSIDADDTHPIHHATSAG